ncbi:MAG: hypothetical protein II937_14640 [Bacteroidales bacterium]|nr:hypothetical protein [Bacteroidales bacterium]
MANVTENLHKIKWLFMDKWEDFEPYKNEHFYTVVFFSDGTIWTQNKFIGKFVAGQGIIIDENNVISANIAVKDIVGLQDAINNAVKVYSAGQGINIDENNIISIEVDNETIVFENGKLKAIGGTSSAIVIDKVLSETSPNALENRVVFENIKWLQENINAINEELAEKNAVQASLELDEQTAKLLLKHGDTNSEVDLSFLLKDGILDDVTLEYEQEDGVTIPTPYFKFSFNAAADKKTIRVSASDIGQIADERLSLTSKRPVQNKTLTSILKNKIDNGGGVSKEIALTLEEYYNMSNKDEDTLYIITDGNTSEEEAQGDNVAIYKGIKFVDASSVSNLSDLVVEKNIALNDIVIVTNMGETLSYTLNGEDKAISGVDNFDVPFRYVGNNEFKPIAFPFIF